MHPSVQETLEPNNGPRVPLLDDPKVDFNPNGGSFPPNGELQGLSLPWPKQKRGTSHQGEKRLRKKRDSQLPKWKTIRRKEVLESRGTSNARKVPLEFRLAMPCLPEVPGLVSTEDPSAELRSPARSTGQDRTRSVASSATKHRVRHEMETKQDVHQNEQDRTPRKPPLCFPLHLRPGLKPKSRALAHPSRPPEFPGTESPQPLHAPSHPRAGPIDPMAFRSWEKTRCRWAESVFLPPQVAGHPFFWPKPWNLRANLLLAPQKPFVPKRLKPKTTRIPFAFCTARWNPSGSPISGGTARTPGWSPGPVGQGLRVIRSLHPNPRNPAKKNPATDAFPWSQGDIHRMKPEIAIETPMGMSLAKTNKGHWFRNPKK